MEFFQSLNEVRKNRHNFKKWEQQQHDDKARRNKLMSEKSPTEEELKAASDYGKTIIKVIDVMDNHSESVAENVETATQPLVAAIPFIGTAIAGLLNARYIHAPQSNIKAEKFNEIANSDEAQKLVEKINEYNKRYTKNSGRFYADDLKSKFKVKNIKDPELKNKALAINKKYLSKVKGANTKIKLGWLGVGATLLASFVGAQIWATNLQVNSSKIARFQARESLDDPKNFVVYTPEQISEAEKELGEHPERLKEKRKNKKLNQGFFRSIVGILKDKKKYKNAIANDTDESKMVQRELTQEEIEQAQRDKDVIQRTVRIINNEAEKYSENMETAAGVLIGGTPFLGAAVGGVIGWIFKKTGFIDKKVGNFIKSKCSENTKNLSEELKALNGKNKGLYNLKWVELAKSISDDANQAIPKVDNAVKKSAKETFSHMKTKIRYYLNGALAHKKGAAIIVGGIGTIITGLTGMFLGLKLQKSAARAGRYTAKRELEKDPSNFIGYTDTEYNSVSDIKNDEKKESKFKGYALFIPRVIKQYFAYSKYKKHEFKHNQELHKILVEQEVSEEQLRNAKNLQRKLFNTFEKVDDKSQTYSESMEAATEIAQPFIAYGAIGLLLTPLVVLGVRIANGKISPSTITKKIVDKLSKSSKIANKKWFKKYLKSVENNIPVKVQKCTVETKPLGHVLKGTDLQNDSIYTLFEKIGKNMETVPSEIRKLSEAELNGELYKLDSLLNKYGIGNKGDALQLKREFMGKLYSTSKETKADMLEIILNPKGVKNMTDESFNIAVEELGKFINFEKLGINLKGIQSELGLKIDLQNLLTRENYLKAFSLTEKISAEGKKLFNKFTSKLEEFTKADTEEKINRILNKYKNKKIREIPEIKKLLENKEFQAIFENKEFAGLKGELDSILETKISEETITGFADSIKPLVAQFKPVLTGVSEAIKNVKTIKISDIVKALKERGKLLKLNPEKMLNELESKIKTMSEQEFEEFMTKMPNFICQIDKATVEECLPKLKTILNNIPKEELKSIKDALIKEFNEHPDEFIKYVTSGKITNMFVTPGVKKALAIAGISWTTFTLLITYAFQSWMADLQLKAGRLGVMKAIESLEDDRYYADIEPGKAEV